MELEEGLEEMACVQQEDEVPPQSVFAPAGRMGFAGPSHPAEEWNQRLTWDKKQVNFCE
jgi:hypothetical protein